jgi:hypothetical protein
MFKPVLGTTQTSVHRILGGVSKKKSCKGIKLTTVLHVVPELIKMNEATLPCLNGTHRHKFTFTHMHTRYFCDNIL